MFKSLSRTMASKRGEIPFATREKVVQLRDNGNSYRKIASELKISCSAVCYILKKNEETGAVSNKPRIGRPSKLTCRQKRQVVRKALNDPKVSAQMIATDIATTSGTVVTPQTVRNILHSEGIKGRQPRRKPLLNEINKRKRLDPHKNTMNRGALIILEGCDRCGKTTQSKMLAESLKQKGIKTEWMTFPDRTTPIGALISNYLMSKENLEDHVIHLLFTANRWELRNKMLCLLNSGTTLIVDRYSFSGVAFSAAKETMDFNWCRQPEAGLPSPDMVLFLELSAEDAAKRGQFGEERYETPEIQKSVRGIYDQLKTDCWKMVDANKSIEDLQQELVMLSESAIRGIGDSEIKSLW